MPSKIAQDGLAEVPWTAFERLVGQETGLSVPRLSLIDRQSCNLHALSATQVISLGQYQGAKTLGTYY
jgi:hypothetical protein